MAERKKTLPHITLKNAPPPYDEFLGDEAGKSEYLYFADGAGERCAERIPFHPDARNYDPVNAWWLCEAATLAYSSPAVAEPVFRQKALFKQVKFLSTPGGTECFVVSNDDFAIVAFRGSEITPLKDAPHDFSNIVKDWVVTNADIRVLDSVGGGKVHRGFAAGAGQVWDNGLRAHIEQLPSRKVWFTGHSLGAALATVAAVLSLAGPQALSDGGRFGGLYTFGSPRVGDKVFADNLKRMMTARGLTYYRFANGNDLVTAVPGLSTPPPVTFEHAGTLLHIDGKGRITDAPSQFEQLKAKVLDLFDQFKGKFLNGIPNAVEDHVPTLYSTHIWNAYVDEQNRRG